MKFPILLFLLSFTLFLCKKKAQLILDFVICARHTVGKPYTTEDVRGPDKFSNSGLVWYCRGGSRFECRSYNIRKLEKSQRA